MRALLHRHLFGHHYRYHYDGWTNYQYQCDCGDAWGWAGDPSSRATTTYRWGHLTRRDTFTTRD